MSERDEDFARLAYAMGWKWSGENEEYECPDERGMLWYIDTPYSHASLPEHLAFVGRIAEELGVNCARFLRIGPSDEIDGWWVSFATHGSEHHATDLAWAAVRAALAAKGVHRG